MNAFRQSALKLIRNSSRTLITFPSTVIFALAFTVVTMIRIQLDWPEQEAYNFLFNCLHWSFAIGAFTGLTAVTFSLNRYDTKGNWILSNLFGLAAVTASFLLLYFFGSAEATDKITRYQRLSDISINRSMIVITIFLLLFILIAGNVFGEYDFSDAFFMFHKAFFIALIYGGVLMAGTSSIAGAIEALLYNDMSEKVYMYISAVVGFLTFILFIGYFPDFRKNSFDEHLETARSHSRFIDILFNSIMIPIVIALTVVLLIWTFRELAPGSQTNFLQLEGIATAYAIGGIWLHILVTHNDTGMAGFYRRIYPVAALLILAAEAWTLIVQLRATGLKTVTYTFTLIWIASVVCVLLLLLMKEKAHPPIVVVVCILSAVSILPMIGYHTLPVTAQASRLEKLLVQEGMLTAGTLTPAESEPADDVREAITDAVLFLADSEDADLPDWFDRKLSIRSDFEKQMGFEQTIPKRDFPYKPSDSEMRTSLFNPGGILDIEGYQWSFQLPRARYEPTTSHELSINGTNYTIEWSAHSRNDVPLLRITKDQEIILEEDMNDFLDGILSEYPPGYHSESDMNIDDLTVTYKTEHLSVLLVFDYVEVYLDPNDDIINYELTLSSIYIKENR